MSRGWVLPIANVGKFIAVGLNYREHVTESNAQLPSEPVVFMKATSCISGPYDDVVIPRGSTKTDWEVELGVVIGTEASYVPRDRALEHVAGYVVVHDVSERSFSWNGREPGTRARDATRSDRSGRGS